MLPEASGQTGKSVETFANQSEADASVGKVKLKYSFMGWDM